MALTIKDFRLFTLKERQQTVFNKNANTHKNTNRLLLPPELPPELVDRAKVFTPRDDARRVRLYDWRPRVVTTPSTIRHRCSPRHP